MSKIVSIEPGYFRIPLETELSDSTHRQITNFELNTIRVRDSDGVEGMGYTFTVGRNGVAIHALFEYEFTDLVIGEEAANTEALWQMLGGADPLVPCYAGGVDLDFPLEKLLAQTDANLKRGFRAIKMKVGRKISRKTSSD